MPFEDLFACHLTGPVSPHNVSNGDRVPGDAALVGPPKVDRRSGEGRGKPLDEGTGPIVVKNFGGGLCPAVDVSRLR
jgi:hypothetical protein